MVQHIPNLYILIDYACQWCGEQLEAAYNSADHIHLLYRHATNHQVQCTRIENASPISELNARRAYYEAIRRPE